MVRAGTSPRIATCCSSRRRRQGEKTDRRGFFRHGEEEACPPRPFPNDSHICRPTKLAARVEQGHWTARRLRDPPSASACSRACVAGTLAHALLGGPNADASLSGLLDVSRGAAKGPRRAQRHERGYQPRMIARGPAGSLRQLVLRSCKEISVPDITISEAVPVLNKTASACFSFGYMAVRQSRAGCP